MTWRPDCSSARGRRPETSRKKQHDRRPLHPGTAGRRTGPKNRQVVCRSAGPRGPAGGPRTGRRPLLRTKRRSAAGPRTCSRPKPRHVVSDRKTVNMAKKTAVPSEVDESACWAGKTGNQGCRSVPKAAVQQAGSKQAVRMQNLGRQQRRWRWCAAGCLCAVALSSVLPRRARRGPVPEPPSCAA